MPRPRPALAVLTALVITTATMRAAVDAWLGAAQPVAAPIAWQPQVSGVTVRLRGVSAVSADVAWASGAAGTVLRTTDGGRTWARRTVPGAEALDFRDVDATGADSAVVLSIGPGDASRIYQTGDGGATWTERFRNADPDAFFDAIAFADATHGAAVSDSVAGRFVIRLTADGGRTWTPVPADRLPPALPGEGAFAASGTNVTMAGRDHLWIGTTAARVLRSSDGGRSWSVHQTPLATGEATGIFSIAFRDDRTGVVVGGNYQREERGGRQRRDDQRRRRDLDAGGRAGAVGLPIGGGVAADTRDGRCWRSARPAPTGRLTRAAPGGRPAARATTRSASPRAATPAGPQVREGGSRG